MSEDKKEQSSSQQGSSEREEAGKKVQQAASAKPETPSAGLKPSSAPTPPTAPAQQPPRPAVAPLPPGPAAATPPPVPPSRPRAAKSAGRRSFLTLLVGVAAVLTVIPFIPWGRYLSSTLESSGPPVKQQVVIDNNPQYGPAAGAVVNVNDLTAFPPNSHWVFTYPSAGNTATPTAADATQNFQNPDTFVKFELIRLPVEMGGNSMKATDFVAFSKVCVHLWCSPNYNPEQCTNQSENGYPTSGTCTPHEQYECPCHGSIYRIPDGLSIAGPASEQPPPTNAIPMLTLVTDSTGILYVVPPVWDIEHNGVIGYGRDYLSYDNYIRPVAAAAAAGPGSSSSITSGTSTTTSTG